MCARRTRTALDAVLVTALGGNLDVLESVLNPLAEEAGEEEGTAVDHVEWASKGLRVHQQRRWTEEPGILRPYIIYEPAGCGITRVRSSCSPASATLSKVT